MSEQTKPKRRFWQIHLSTAFLILLAIGAMLAIVAPVIFSFRRSVDVSMQAEYTLQANDYVLLLADKFIKENPGRWPGSWEELQRTTFPKYGFYEWPRDVDKIKERVHIDFNARLEDLSEQTRESFKAIKPIGPYYESHYVEILIDTIHADVQRKNNSK